MNESPFQKLTGIWNSLDAHSFFQLSPEEQQLATSALKPDGKPLIEAWSFVPHPLVFSKIGMEIHRYIVMVDTMSSDVYDPVLEFLSRDIPNVSTYYSGGNADFVCDVNMTDQNFASWKDDLCKVLRDCGGKSFVEPGHDVKDLLTIFRAAENALIRCGTAVNEYGPPTRKGN